MKQTSTTTTTLLLVLMISSLNLVKAECQLGKCMTCDVDADGNEKCQACFKSRLTADGKCEGDNTGVDNCVISSEENGAISCYGSCDVSQNYHWNSVTSQCYQGTVDPNCYSETTSAGPVVTCNACKNGYVMQNGGVGSDACVETANSAVEGCLGMIVANTCTQCAADYYQSGNTCTKRESDEQKTCQSGTGQGGSSPDGNLYCQSCNLAGRYYAVGIKNAAQNSIPLQECQLWADVFRLGAPMAMLGIWAMMTRGL